jgi:plastocyanin
MRRLLLVLPVLALGALLGVTSRAQAAATITVNVGGGGSGIAANDFFPDEFSLHQGDTVHFVNPYAEPHTTTFVPLGEQEPPLIIPSPLGGPELVFNPLASNPTHTAAGAYKFDRHQYYNSGLMFKDDAVDITFLDGGSYKFICLLHPGMEVTVNVVGAAESTADTQAQITARGKADLDAVIAQGETLAASIPLTSTQETANGPTTWNLTVGATQGHADVMQFLPPQTLKINVGDSVKWTSITDTPHTVTFGAQPPPLTELPNPGGDPPSFLTFAPAALLPSGGPTYAGGDANSGIIDEEGSFPGGSSFMLTFTKAGTYTYVCLLHADQGMAGVIEVGGAAAPATQPTATTGRGGITGPDTGSGGTPADGGGAWALGLAMLGLAGGAIVLGATRALWRRAA